MQYFIFIFKVHAEYELELAIFPKTFYYYNP